MKEYLKQNIWPVIAGFGIASVIMTAFEYANSLIYPFPEGMNTRDLEQVREFSMSMPSTAYILVFLGWAVGTFVAAVLVSKMVVDKKKTFNLLSALVIILTLAGLFNNIAFAAPVWFIILGILVFPVFAYFGYLFANKK